MTVVVRWYNLVNLLEGKWGSIIHHGSTKNWRWVHRNICGRHVEVDITLHRTDCMGASNVVRVVVAVASRSAPSCEVITGKLVAIFYISIAYHVLLAFSFTSTTVIRFRGAYCGCGCASSGRASARCAVLVWFWLQKDWWFRSLAVTVCCFRRQCPLPVLRRSTRLEFRGAGLKKGKNMPGMYPSNQAAACDDLCMMRVC